MDLVRSINDGLGETKLEKDRLNRAFEAQWPKLDERLSRIPKLGETQTPRSEESMLEEILETVRALSRTRSDQIIPVRAADLKDWNGILGIPNPIDRPGDIEGFFPDDDGPDQPPDNV